MSLKDYFSNLIFKVENSDEISNAGKDKDGFYKPKKTILIRHLTLLRDLHNKPLAKNQVKAAWAAVIEELPPEWLVLEPEQKEKLKEILK